MEQRFAVSLLLSEAWRVKLWTRRASESLSSRQALLLFAHKCGSSSSAPVKQIMLFGWESDHQHNSKWLLRAAFSPSQISAQVARPLHSHSRTASLLCAQSRAVPADTTTLTREEARAQLLTQLQARCNRTGACIMQKLPVYGREGTIYSLLLVKPLSCARTIARKCSWHLSAAKSRRTVCKDGCAFAARLTLNSLGAICSDVAASPGAGEGAITILQRFALVANDLFTERRVGSWAAPA